VLVFLVKEWTKMENHGLNAEVFGEVEESDDNSVLTSASPKQDSSGTWHNGLGYESTAEHKHVAKTWQDKCITVKGFADKVAEDATKKVDEEIDLHDFRLDPDMTFRGLPLTIHAINSIVRCTRSLPIYPDQMVDPDTLINNSKDPKTSFPISMTRWLLAYGFKEDLAKFLNFSIARYENEQKKDRRILLRKRWNEATNSEVIRWIASDRYGAIDNDIWMDIIGAAIGANFISKSLASHCHNNGDDITCNILLPDNMKTNLDSEYGSGVNVKNSEVGRYLCTAAPFVFRDICFNGMIWGRQDSKYCVKKKHLGEIDFNWLRNEAINKVNLAISDGHLLVEQIQHSIQCPVPIEDTRYVVEYLRNKNNLSETYARAWYKGILDTRNEPKDISGSAMEIVNGLTRAANNYPDSNIQGELQGIAGSVLTSDLHMDLPKLQSRWADIINLSKRTVTNKDVEMYLAIK
jgi:hypothetical protein